MVRCESDPGPEQATALATVTPTQCTVMPSVSCARAMGRLRKLSATTKPTIETIFSILQPPSANLPIRSEEDPWYQFENAHKRSDRPARWADLPSRRPAVSVV